MTDTDTDRQLTPRGRDRRQALLDYATQRFAEQGFHPTSVADIVDAIEGDGGFTASDIDASSMLTGTVDTNGVPTAASGGQGKKYSQIPVINACADTDGDGKVTAGEFEKARGRMLAKLDRNGDGAVTREEIEERMRHRPHRH